MKIKEKIFIAASPERVWKYLEDPNNMVSWNPKVKSVTAFQTQRGAGTSFGIMYELSGRAMEYRGEITTFVPKSHLVFTFTGGSFGLNNSVSEEFRLQPEGNETLVERTVHFGNANMPFWSKILFWIIFSFGKPIGEPYLAGIKQIIEGQTNG